MTRWNDQFKEDRNFPIHSAAPTVRYIVASTPRSGSHFLGQMLRQTGLLGDPLEYFDRGNRKTWEHLASAANESTQTYIERRRTTPNGCFGMKLHHTQLGSALREFAPSGLFGRHRFIFLRRRDVLRQAVSFSVASQTGSWISAVPVRSTATYDFDDITAYLTEVCLQEAQWRATLAVHRANYLEVMYEDVVRDPLAAIIRIADYLGVDSASIPAANTATARQSTDITNQYVERYLRDVRSNPEQSRSTQDGITGFRRRPFRVKRIAAKALSGILGTDQ